MSFLAQNLKYLRKLKNITQQQLADILMVKRPVIGAYEESRAEPKLETLQKIVSYFDLTLEELVYKALGDDWLEERNRANDPSLARLGQSARVLSITVNAENTENIEIVPVKASAGYMNGFADPQYLTSLQRFHLPMFTGGTFRAFELTGDSMLPLQPGTFVIAEYLENWNLLKSGETYIILSRNDGIVYKRVQNKLKEHKRLKLISDNPVYEPYSIGADDILEIWKAKAFLSMQLPEPVKEASIGQLAEMVTQMQRSLKDIKAPS